MSLLTIQIHPSIRIDTIPKDYSKKFEKKISLQDAIVEMMKPHPEMKETLIENDRIKPGLMVFADKTELTSMGLLDQELENDLKIRIVPILHGG